MAKLRTYSIRVLAGLENLVAEDLRKRLKHCEYVKEHRTLLVTTDCDPEELNQLRGVDDVFILAGFFQNLGKERTSLEAIACQASSFVLTESIATCSQIRNIDLEKGFSITASFIGKRNYNRWEISDKVKELFCEKLKSRYLNSRDQALPDHDLHIRIHLYRDQGWCGVRLGKSSLFRREYKGEHVKGSLLPQLAHWMVRLSEVGEGDVLLDPMCGAGTIVIEAALYDRRVKAIGVDISAEAIKAAEENSKEIPGDITFMQGDAADLTFADESIGCIVSDLPWGGANIDS